MSYPKPISKKDQADKVPLRVVLNGTSINPFLKYGLTMNPFPQIPKAELMQAMMQLNRLAADPIPMNDYARYIREKLSGWSDEFIDLCISNFVPGERSTFTVYLDKGWCD